MLEQLPYLYQQGPSLCFNGEEPSEQCCNSAAGCQSAFSQVRVPMFHQVYSQEGGQQRTKAGACIAHSQAERSNLGWIHLQHAQTENVSATLVWNAWPGTSENTKCRVHRGKHDNCPDGRCHLRN